MLVPLELLVDNPCLRELLEQYRHQREQSPEAEWHDRVMHLAELTDEEMSELHGLLLACGWLDVRVHNEAFRTVGRLRDCYRISSDGIEALRMIENPLGLEAVSEEINSPWGELTTEQPAGADEPAADPSPTDESQDLAA